MPRVSNAIGADSVQLKLAPCDGPACSRAHDDRSASAWFLVAIVMVGLGFTACQENSPAKHGTLALPVDSGLVPAQDRIGSQPVGRMMGDAGIAMDFVLGELIVATDDQTKLDALLNRWGATVLDSFDPVGDLPRIYRIHIDPDAADVGQLLADLNERVPELRGAFRSSSEAAAKLLSVVLSETNAGGMTVTPNFVVSPAGIREGSTTEAATGDDGLYSPNAFAWPYMNRGSAQDVGVGAAWRAMQRAGVFRNKVRIMILDRGFSPNADFPTVQMVRGDWNVPNPTSCGGGACPWHGSMVTSAAMGTVDDRRGSAGPAGPVAELLAVESGSNIFSDMSKLVHAAAVDNPRIINISSGFELDLGWEILLKVACLGLCPSLGELFSGITASVSATNRLIFAAAGNAGKDVDNGGASPEGSLFIPCELYGVICVGGMAHDSTALAPASNFGSRANDDSVEIYGPFSTWVTDPAGPGSHASLAQGTSLSSPFVAGVAALVWASRPDLAADQVWGIVRDTAHVGGVHSAGGLQRRVNAFGAVARLLGGAPPAVVLNASGATAPLHREWWVTAVVSDDDGLCSPEACPLTWNPAPARTIGNTAYYRFGEVGMQTVRLTARDPVDQATTVSTTVDVVNSAPVVTISAPATGTSVPQNVALQFLGWATDANEGPDPGPGPLACDWRSSSSGDVFPDDCDFQASFRSQGRRTVTLTATDPTGLSTRASVVVIVTAPPANFPPTVSANVLLPPPFNDDRGYAWDATFSLTSRAIDPEDDTPITYVWTATSFRPNSTTVFMRVTLGTTAELTWSPSATPGLLGTFDDFGNACYDGQILRLQVEATDSLGNTSRAALPDLRVYRCILA